MYGSRTMTASRYAATFAVMTPTSQSSAGRSLTAMKRGSGLFGQASTCTSRKARTPNFYATRRRDSCVPLRAVSGKPRKKAEQALRELAQTYTERAQASGHSEHQVSEATK